MPLQLDYRLSADLANSGIVRIDLPASYLGTGLTTSGAYVEYDSGGKYASTSFSITIRDVDFLLTNSSGVTWKSGRIVRVILSEDPSTLGASLDSSGNVNSLLSPDASVLYPNISTLTQHQLKKWRAALANVMNGSANAKLAFLGDSTTAGAFASGVIWSGNRTLAVPARIAAMLTARGINAQQGSTFCDAGTTDAASFALYDTRWVLGAGWTTQLLTGGCGGTALTHNAASTTTAAFTPTAAFDTIEIWTVTNPAYQDFTVNVDGGASLGTIDASQALSILKTTYTVALSTHTVNIQKSAGNAALTHIIGINTYDSATKAVQVWNMGYGGSTSAFWGTSTTSVWLAPQMVATYAPDMSVICLGINDWIAAVSAATFKTQMQVLIDKALISGSAMLVTSAWSQIGYNGATQANMDAIVTATRELAVTNNLPLLDISKRLVNYSDANSYGFYGDGAHPDKTGYQDWANALYPFLAP